MTQDFFSNVIQALQSSTSKALRLDQLADLVEPVAADGSHRWRFLDKLKAGLTFDNPKYTLISAREQEGYGLSQEEFPREAMGERPGTKKRIRTTESQSKKEKQPKFYWPVVAIRDQEMSALAAKITSLVPDKFEVTLRASTITVKVKG